MRGKRLPAILLLLCAAFPARPDTVYLKNGRTYADCKARVRSDGSVEIVLPGGTIVLPKDKVAYIEYGKVELRPSASGPRLSPVLEEIFSAGKAAAGGGAGPGKKSDVRRRAEALIALLRSGSEEDRAAAREGLLALGEPALPYLLPALEDENGFVRIGVSWVLARLAPKTAVKQVLEALYAVSPDKAPVPRSRKVFAVNLRNALRAATGQNFGYWPELATQSEALRRWIEWYDANKLSLPPQVGEPKLDPDDKDYEKKLAEVRSLKLRKRGFAAGNASSSAEREAK